jgi:hypothetical protein
MKTYREQLEGLPDGWRDAALRNAEEQDWFIAKSPDDICNSPLDALQHSFDWSKTKEKHTGWSIPYLAIRRGLPIAPYPYQTKSQLSELEQLRKEVKELRDKLSQYERQTKRSVIHGEGDE